jgi:AcrR family transcriptional regulator
MDYPKQIVYLNSTSVRGSDESFRNGQTRTPAGDTSNEEPGGTANPVIAARPIRPVALLHTVLELFGHIPPEKVTIADVLAASGISYGSLYHHYDGFPHLIEQALLTLFGRHVRRIDRSADRQLPLRHHQSRVRQQLSVITRATHTR